MNGLGNNAGSKHARHTAIRDVIERYTGSTQEQIKEHLCNLGIIASQSTLSRDLRELGAVKVPLENGKLVYTFSGLSSQQGFVGELASALTEFMTEYEKIGNFIVIKTKPGNARDLCLFLDRQNWKEIAGTIAGDDTILIITRKTDDVDIISEKFKFYIGKD